MSSLGATLQSNKALLGTVNFCNHFSENNGNLIMKEVVNKCIGCEIYPDQCVNSHLHVLDVLPFSSLSGCYDIMICFNLTVHIIWFVISFLQQGIIEGLGRY